MANMKTDIHFSVSADILTKVYSNVPGVLYQLYKLGKIVDFFIDLFF